MHFSGRVSVICLPLGRMAGGVVDGFEWTEMRREALVCMTGRRHNIIAQYHFKKAEGGRFKQVDRSGGVGDVIMAGRNQQ